jgi:hypothetical protein
MNRLLGILGMLIIIFLVAAQPAQAINAPSNKFVQVSSAFVTNLIAHEYGHAVVGSTVGGEGLSVEFFTKEKNNLFLGHTAVDRIEDRSYPAFALGGEIGASVSFEYALYAYRQEPTWYTKSLLFFSGTDFLWYTLYTFYVNPDNPESDPNVLVEKTGISKDVLISVAVTQSLLNGYRVISGEDTVIPQFTFDKNSIGFNLKIPF